MTKDKKRVGASRRANKERRIFTAVCSCLMAAVMLASLFSGAIAVRAAGEEQAEPSESENKPFTVMLDAGHGGNDPGATRTVDGVEYSERAFNDKLMNACYERLIQYDGVIVYRTRVANNHISTYARAAFANNVGADVFLSFHINSSSYKSARGASTIIPCGNYRPEMKRAAVNLTDKILSRLSDLGLKNNGFMTRVLEDAQYLDYPDGSAGDYYEVIRMGVRYGIPSLILETAFITSDTDLAILNNDTKIKEIGAAVADAIAAQYGLKITGNKLAQPEQTAQTSGVSLGSIPKTLNLGDVVPLTASGGSGEGNYEYLASNPYIARVEGNNLIVIGSGDFRVTVTRFEGVTTTPRSAGNTNVKAVALSTSVVAEAGKLEFSPADNLYKMRVSVRLKDQIDGIVPRGTVKARYAKGNSSVDYGEIVTEFGEDGTCSFEFTFNEPGQYICSVRYEQGYCDGYLVSAPEDFSITVDQAEAETPTPEPTLEPTEAPTEEATEVPATPELTAASTPEATLTEKEVNGNASVSFGMLEILVALLVVAVIVTIVLVIKLARKKKRG
ncbi:MAG: N-acetylmuramoyl-L-alanine amidase [Clostridia bacterium]|nr:N-acetylmuramoyl-L-alanine amidase [Clostridia bacterium]